MNFGKSDWGISKMEAFQILDTFADLGYNQLDTSNFYAQGNSKVLLVNGLSVIIKKYKCMHESRR
ncbi:MAG: aldo/keto reductase [Saprospiraceae bacterium]|nr:aldo/keto reductase [Saprospiraceae bacterium]